MIWFVSLVVGLLGAAAWILGVLAFAYAADLWTWRHNRGARQMAALGASLIVAGFGLVGVAFFARAAA